MLKLAHIILAFLLLIGSTGLVVNKHFCQNELKSMTLFLEAKACHNRNQPKSCPMHAPQETHAEQGERKDCCNDQTEYLKAEEDQLLSSFEWQLKKPIPALISAAWLPVKKNLAVDPQTLHYLNYKPPLIIYDRRVRFETFLC